MAFDLPPLAGKCAQDHHRVFATLVRIDPEHSGEAAEAEKEGGGHAQLDDLGVGKMPLQLGEELCVEPVVVGGQQLCKANGQAFPRRKHLEGVAIQGGDLVFGQAFLPGPGIAYLQSVLAGIEAGDFEADELFQGGLQQPLFG